LRIYKEENKWNLHIHERTLYLVGKYERERERERSTNLCCPLLAIPLYSGNVYDAWRENWISCCPYCNFCHSSNIDRGGEQGPNKGKLFEWFCMLKNLQRDCNS
jgi:hypothetical protein